MFIFVSITKPKQKSLFLLSLSVDYNELDNIGINFQNITVPELTSILTHKKLHTVF